MTCRDVSTVVVTGQFDAKPFRRKLQIRLHIAMCRHCRRFWRQIRQLDEGMRGALATFDLDKPSDLEDRITSQLDEG